MPTAQQVVIRGVVVETDLPTSTCTTYTIVYKSGTITVDVHELISRWLNDVVEDIVAIYLVLPDPATQPVWVHVDEVEPRIGFEISIDGADHTPIEFVAYENELRDATVEHSVWVHGFVTAPAVPALPEGEE